jgi:hypothetical protein
VCTRAEWDALPERGTQRFDWGEVQQLKNCTCGTTLAILLVPGEPQDPVVGAIWKAKNASTHVKITAVTPAGVAYRTVRGKRREFVPVAEFFNLFTPVTRTP